MNKKSSKTLHGIIFFNICLIILTIYFYILHQRCYFEWILPVYITLLTTSYHFIMRLIVGEVTNIIYKKRTFNQNSLGFRMYDFEQKLYLFLKVKKWKGYVITAKPEYFDIKQNTLDELLHSVMQAELVHRIIMPLSFMPMLLIIPYGTPLVFVTTSVIACMIDLQFVIIQRYNRPRIIKLQKVISEAV